MSSTPMADSVRIAAVDDMAEYLSRLPESLIHHILSFLPFKQIYRTCVLSKYFNSVWCNYPNLEFYLVDRKFINPECAMNSVEQCIVRRPFIRQLRIQIFWFENNNNNLTTKLDRWLCPSVDKNLSRLVLETGILGSRYSVPQQVLVSRTLEVLDLTHCTLEEDRIVHIDLPRLEKLSLYDCRFVGENLLQKILCGSPNIKHISLNHCGGLGNYLSISCTPLLTHFSLRCYYEFERIKIDAPSLHTLSYESCDAIDFTTCTNLKELYLHRGIRQLELNRWRLKNEYKISSPSLKRLAINDLCDFPGVDIDAPNLSSLEVSLNQHLSLEFNFCSWSIPKADDINMTFSAKGFQEACRAGLEDFLLKLHKYQDVKCVIFDHDYQNFIVIEELKAVSFSSLENFSKKTTRKTILISMKAETSWVSTRLGSPYIMQATISLICSSPQFAESFYKKLGNCSTVKNKYRHELVSPGEVKQLLSPSWESFIESNSRGNHNASIILHKRTPKDRMDH